MKKVVNWKTIILACMVLVACVMCVTSSRAWFTVTPGVDHAIQVHADGVVYINIATAVDTLGEDTTGRVMSPAVALPFAVANGAPMDVTKTYAETAGTDHPSYIQRAATYGTFSGEFEYSQSANQGSYLSFDLGMYLNASAPETQLGKNEFVIDEISFSYVQERIVGYELVCQDNGDPLLDDDGNQVQRALYQKITLNPLEYDSNCFVSADNTHGQMFIYGMEKAIVFFSVRMHIANVDELMDSRLNQQETVFCGIALAVTSMIGMDAPAGD